MNSKKKKKQMNNILLDNTKVCPFFTLGNNYGVRKPVLLLNYIYANCHHI